MTIPRFLASALSAPTVWLGGYLLVSADVYRADRVREAVRHDVAAERAARPAVAVTADGEHVSVRAVLDQTLGRVTEGDCVPERNIESAGVLAANGHLEHHVYGRFRIHVSPGRKNVNEFDPGPAPAGLVNRAAQRRQRIRRAVYARHHRPAGGFPCLASCHLPHLQVSLRMPSGSARPASVSGAQRPGCAGPWAC